MRRKRENEGGEGPVSWGGRNIADLAQKENLCSFFNLPSGHALLQFIYVLTLKSPVITILDARV
jgi:hypothetical protein